MPWEICSSIQNQENQLVLQCLRILYCILVRTIYPHDSLKEKNNDTLFETFYYIIKGYSIDFVKIICKYMTKVCNLAHNFPLPYLNLLTYIFKYFHNSLDVEEHIETKISAINESTLKSLKFTSLSNGH